MKNLIFLLLSVSIIACCNDDIEIITDVELTSYYWTLDSITYIDRGGNTLYNEDSSIFEGKSIVISFSDGINIQADYGPIVGNGKYELFVEKEITIFDFGRGDFVGVNSAWFNKFSDGIDNTTKYSINNRQLSLFYNNRRMHFTQL